MRDSPHHEGTDDPPEVPRRDRGSAQPEGAVIPASPTSRSRPSRLGALRLQDAHPHRRARPRAVPSLPGAERDGA